MFQETTKSAMTRRSLLKAGALVLGAAGGGLVLSSCATSEPAPSEDGAATGNGQEKLSQIHMTPSAFSSSFVEVMVAKEKGYFDEFDLDIELQQAGATPLPAMASLAEGKIDYGRETGTGGIISMVGRGLPLRGIATIRQRSQWEIVSLPGAGISSPSDLEGKRVGVIGAGGITESFVIMMAQNYGVDPDDVERPIVSLGMAGLEHARADELDAWISLDSHRLAIQESGVEIVHNYVDEFLQVPSDTYMVTEDVVNSDSDAPARFLAAVRKAVFFTMDEDNWVEAGEIVNKFNKDVSPDSVVRDLPLVIDQWRAKGDENILQLQPEDWEIGQEQLMAAGTIDTTKPVEDLIYDGYLEEAKTLSGI